MDHRAVWYALCNPTGKILGIEARPLSIMYARANLTKDFGYRIARMRESVRHLEGMMKNTNNVRVFHHLGKDWGRVHDQSVELDGHLGGQEKIHCTSERGSLVKREKSNAH